MGENPDGTPIYRTTYAVMSVPQDVDLDPTKPEDKAILDRLNKFAPASSGKWGGTNGDGVQHFTGTQFNAVAQEAADNEAATAARNKTLADNEISDADRNQKLEIVKIGVDWNNALANAGNDPLKALAAMQANPRLVQQYPHLYQDVRQAYGEKSFDSLVELRQKKIEAVGSELDDAAKELAKGVGADRALSMATALQKRLDDPNTPAEQKPRLKQLVDQASSASAAVADNDVRQAGRKKEAEAGAEARTKGNQPVYAYNTQTKQLEQATRQDVAANPTVYTNPVDIKESDIRKDTELARQLGDAQLNLSRYRAAAQKMDEVSYGQNWGNPGGSERAMSSLLADDRFKAEFLGLQVPTDWLNKLADSENWKSLNQSQKDAVIGYIGARGAVIAYQKAVSGSGRANKEQLELELQNIPTPLLPKDVRERQFDRFQQNIDQTGAGMPKMVGIERPKEIRQRIEVEEAQKEQDAAKQQGATHVYDPNSGQIIPTDATPIKNIFGKVIGYNRNGQQILFNKGAQ